MNENVKKFLSVTLIVLVAFVAVGIVTYAGNIIPPSNSTNDTPLNNTTNNTPPVKPTPTPTETLIVKPTENETPIINETKPIVNVTKNDSLKNITGIQITALKPFGSAPNEYFNLTNFADGSVDIAGFTLHEKTCGTNYTFGECVIEPNETIQFFTHEGKNSSEVRYLGFKHHIFNQNDNKNGNVELVYRTVADV